MRAFAYGSGTPYILYKDSANRKSNQQNLGTIRCSNLCTEIIEFTSPDEVAVCNLASIALPRFVSDSKVGTYPPHNTAGQSSGNPVVARPRCSSQFDHQKLHEITYIVTRNLNRVIDNNYCSRHLWRLTTRTLYAASCWCRNMAFRSPAVCTVRRSGARGAYVQHETSADRPRSPRPCRRLYPLAHAIRLTGGAHTQQADL